MAFCLVLGSILLGNLQYQDGGIGRNKAFFLISSRSFSRTLVIIPKHRIQALEVSQSFVQKFRTLFTIQTSILTSITGKSFRSIDVSTEQKEEVLDWFTYEK
ncbi:hypothetical protein BKP37_07205 [Anaerobacillus alkalilacustris]|uniref:YdbS-like PH domain-containing protein n=1 Tax=Anaerobacillus alkalilacustris TaxID=393763 RepID=A0A1S2LRC7_9BACI|nr:PH domain-containing protein [Anaerobacillus alkalilacustris]OIJ14760.1 hypothetical protein BKP37_07205 [Anaerobacillus alkalilacustris]